jgi:O-antigen ligase
MEFKMLRPVWGAHVPSFLRIEDEQIMGVLSGSQRSATGQYRVQSTSTTSLGLSEMLALTVPFVIHFATYIRSYAVKVAAILSLPLMFYVVILTDSRLGMIGFLLSLMLYLLLWAVLRWRAAKGSLIAPAIVLAYPAIFTVFVVATFAVGRLRNMVWGNGDTAASDGARYVQYVTGIPKVLAAPWGYGASMGGGVLGYYQPNGLLTIDTYYLSVALEFGVLGFFTFYGMIMAAIYYAGRPVLKSPQGEYSFFVPLSISLVNFFVIKSVFSQQDNHPLVFMMMGIVAALAYRQSVEAKAENAAL